MFVLRLPSQLHCVFVHRTLILTIAIAPSIAITIATTAIVITIAIYTSRVIVDPRANAISCCSFFFDPGKL